MEYHFLEQIGLTKGEIAVYTTLLKIGQTTTGPLIKRSKISASKTYQILDKLMNKGLVSFIIQSGTKYFEPTQPERILDYLEEKEQVLKQQKKEATTFIEQAKLLQQHTDTSDATVFKGLKGLKTAYLLSQKDIQKNGTVYGMFLPQVRDELIPFFKEYISTFSKEYKAKNLLLFNEYSTEIDAVQHITGVQIRIVPNEFKAPTEISIHNNNVLIATTGSQESIAVLIKSKDIADSFKKYFHTIWEISQPINQKPI